MEKVCSSSDQLPNFAQCAVSVSWYINIWRAESGNWPQKRVMWRLGWTRVGSSWGSSNTQNHLGVLDLFKQERVDKGIETDGSNLSGVSAKCAWDDLSRPPEDDEDSRSICIGTQPRRLSGKGERSWTETLSEPFGLFSDGSGQWAASCSILGFRTNTTVAGRLSMSQERERNSGVASLCKAGEKKRDLCVVLSKCFLQGLGYF